MRLRHLSLTNFRNFVRLETELAEGLTLVVGANAQGKTSLLESIYYLTGARSPHAANDRQLINFLGLQEASPFSRVMGEVSRGDRLHRIEIRILLEAAGPMGEKRTRKEIHINGLKRRVRDLAGGFNAVMFLPQDLRILEGSPGERRRYLDATISQADPLYAESLAEYAKVLSQRNALLKQLQEENGDEGQLTFWDEQLTEQAALLIRARALAVSELERLAVPLHHELTRGVETLRLVYHPAYDPLQPPKEQLGLPLNIPVDRTAVSRAEIRDGMLAALEASRSEEIGAGMTLIGPHRDDLRFLANGIDLHTYGSRGQNRTAMLTAKLAEVEWLEERSGECPVLLLDEVLAELDAERRLDLQARVGDAQQAVLSAADLGMFEEGFVEAAAIWKLTAGEVERLH